MRITKPYSPLWFTDNELSQLTPMPKTWDITGPDQASDCTEVVADCAAVYQYLIKQAEDTSTYATSKLWADVDGPWKLASFAVDGPVKFDLNPSYGGPLPPHHISHFEEVPFT